MQNHFPTRDIETLTRDIQLAPATSKPHPRPLVKLHSYSLFS